jgi:hypothetical protein
VEISDSPISSATASSSDYLVRNKAKITSIIPRNE